jgi:hypothetical protein
MTGNYTTELSIGRFPCSTAININTIVAKIFSYERTPFLDDTSWYKKGTSIIRDVGMSSIDTICWNAARYIMQLWQAAGYTHIDSFARLLGNHASDIESAITDGRAFVVYHGESVVNWWSPFAVSITRINNGFKLPIIISASEALISMIYSGYLGEIMLTAGSEQNPKGAVGFFSTTIPAADVSLISKSIISKGFFKSLFLDGIYKLGDLTKRAKYIVDSIHPQYYDTTRYREWNLLGDPELNLWTAVPKLLSVTFDSVIPPNPTNVTVTVMSNGVPVPNALICLMKDTTIYEYGYTDNTGIKVFSISPQDTGIISITVTAQNCHPYEGIIRVSLSGVEENKMLQASNFTLQVSPNPAKTLTAIRYSLPIQENVKLQLYDISGRLIKTLINERKSAGNYSLIWNGTDDNNRKVGEGVYFCILKTDNEFLKQKILMVK